jgi:hypothetical protein
MRRISKILIEPRNKRSSRDQDTIWGIPTGTLASVRIKYIQQIYYDSYSI